MNKLSRKQNFIIISIILILVAVLVTGVTLAYLTATYEPADTDVTVGFVEPAIYTNNTVRIDGKMGVNGYELGKPVSVALGNSGVASSVDLQIGNIGDIPAIMRIMVILNVERNGQDEILTTNEASISNAGWINSYPDSTQHFFYSYYNSQLAANGKTSNILTITPTSLGANLYVVVSVAVEMVAYSGNAYKVNNAVKPFGTAPSGWTAWQ